MTAEDLLDLFVPHVLERRAALAAGKRLVHYTTAENAYKIITGGEVWMRNASMMNDFSEMQYGMDCLDSGWMSDTGQRFQELLDRLKPGLRDELVGLISGHADGFRHGTFIISLSEHDDDEDELGRLSMWRAYGGSTGIALVMNNQTFLAETDVMNVYSTPVIYQSIGDFKLWFENWANKIIDSEDKLTNIDADVLKNWLFLVFRTIILCTKHPGFAEEREWRVFHSPMLEDGSDWLKNATELIRGVPQPLVKLQLFDDEARGIVGVAPKTLINRVIIGPCDYPLQVRAAICGALLDAGVEAPLEKVVMSNVPLRHS